jgi:hypothetical protein
LCRAKNQKASAFPPPVFSIRAISRFGIGMVQVLSIAAIPVVVLVPRCFRWNRRVHGFPHRAGSFRKLCALCDSARGALPKLRVNSAGGINNLRGDFVWLHGSRRVAEDAEENKPNCGPIAAGTPLKTAKNRCGLRGKPLSAKTLRTQTLSLFKIHYSKFFVWQQNRPPPQTIFTFANR